MGGRGDAIMTTLCIISCDKAKLPTPAAAHRLYTGGYFKTQLAWARSHYPVSSIRILSAKHGLIKLTDVLHPYDVKMGQPGSITAEQIALQLPQGAHIITSCGSAYLKRLRVAAEAQQCTLEVPFDGYPGMGHKASAMKRATRPGRNL